MDEQDERPLCKCHGEPMQRNGSKTPFICRIRANEKSRRSYAIHRERKIARVRAWQVANPEKMKDYTSSRLQIMIGGTRLNYRIPPEKKAELRETLDRFREQQRIEYRSAA